MTADGSALGRLPCNFSWVDESLAGSGHPGYWPEDLRNSLAALRDEGVGAVVSLAPLAADVVAEAGLAHCALPVPDMGVPELEELAEAVAFAQASLADGKRILAHCGAGYGRTGLFLACVLVSRGRSAEEAIDLVRTKRPGSIETREQEDLIRVWAERVHGGTG